MSAVIVSRGHGWHVKVGPIIVCNFRPPSGAPWADQGWTALTDDQGAVLDRFCGWGVRSPRFFVGIGGRFATRLSIWQGWRRRRRWSGVSGSAMSCTNGSAESEHLGPEMSA